MIVLCQIIVCKILIEHKKIKGVGIISPSFPGKQLRIKEFKKLVKSTVS